MHKILAKHHPLLSEQRVCEARALEILVKVAVSAQLCSGRVCFLEVPLGGLGKGLT